MIYNVECGIRNAEFWVTSLRIYNNACCSELYNNLCIISNTVRRYNFYFTY